MMYVALGSLIFLVMVVGNSVFIDIVGSLLIACLIASASKVQGDRPITDNKKRV